MTYETISDQIKFITGQDNLSTTDALRIINFALDAYSDIYMKADGRWKFDPHTTLTNPIATTALVANQSQYELDTDFLQIDRVEVLVNGVYKPLTPIDRNEDKENSLTALYQTAGTPTYYDFDGNSIYLYPAPSQSITSGLKVFHTRPVDYITALTETVSIPRIHAEYLAIHGAYQVSIRTNDQNRTQLQNQLLILENKVRDYFTVRDEDRPRRLRPKTEGAFIREF